MAVDRSPRVRSKMPRATSVERQRVRWAWTADGTWDAPDLARFRYVKEPELFKLYIVSPLPAGCARPYP